MINDNKHINLSNTKQASYLYERYFCVFSRYVNTIIDNNEEAGDIVQSYFIKIYEDARCFDNIKAFRAFSYKSLKNSSINYLKLCSRFSNEVEDSVVTCAEDEVVKNELRRELYDEINKLPKTRRDVLLMQLKGMTYEDIALALKTTKGTIKTHLRLARKNLNKTLFIKIFILHYPFFIFCLFL